MNVSNTQYFVMCHLTQKENIFFLYFFIPAITRIFRNSI